MLEQALMGVAVFVGVLLLEAGVAIAFYFGLAFLVRDRKSPW